MILFENVTKRFGDNQPTLVDVSFQVEPGEFVFVLGESGAGKTTLMRLLTGELKPTAGKVEFLGKNIGSLAKRFLPKHRRELAVVFQDYKLLADRTVAENIAIGLEILGKSNEEIRSRITDLLELVSLQGKEHVFPSQLSGGEMQRVSIARALAVAPKMIFADEPTGNLDWESSVSIVRLLERIAELGTTVMMASHNLPLVRLLKKRELHLHKGALIKDTRGVKKTVSEAQHPEEETSHPKIAEKHISPQKAEKQQKLGDKPHKKEHKHE